MIYKANLVKGPISPKTIKDHPSIKDRKTIFKAFDKLGVKDFTTTSSFFESKPVLDKFRDIEYEFGSYNTYPSCSALEQYKVAKYRLMLNHIVTNTDKDLNVLHPLVLDGKTIINTKDPVVKIVSSIAKDIVDIKSTYFKNRVIEALNLLNRKEDAYNVVFSTNPYDILTMSMRGIYSCMRFNSYHHIQLVGSILDPYVGVIYATNGNKTDYGTYMNYRSVVRVALRNNKASLFVEGAYPKVQNNYGNVHNQNITEEFTRILKSALKDNKKIAGVVNTYSCCDRHNYLIPLSKSVNLLATRYWSCIDSGISYTNNIYSFNKLIKYIGK